MRKRDFGRPEGVWNVDPFRGLRGGEESQAVTSGGDKAARGHWGLQMGCSEEGDVKVGTWREGDTAALPGSSVLR